MQAIRRVGIALGALVEAAPIVWLVGGFVPAGAAATMLAMVLGGLIYADITGRERESR